MKFRDGIREEGVRKNTNSKKLYTSPNNSNLTLVEHNAALGAKVDLGKPEESSSTSIVVLKPPNWESEAPGWSSLALLSPKIDKNH